MDMLHAVGRHKIALKKCYFYISPHKHDSEFRVMPCWNRFLKFLMFMLQSFISFCFRRDITITTFIKNNPSQKKTFFNSKLWRDIGQFLYFLSKKNLCSSSIVKWWIIGIRGNIKLEVGHRMLTREFAILQWMDSTQLIKMYKYWITQWLIK